MKRIFLLCSVGMLALMGPSPPAWGADAAPVLKAPPPPPVSSWEVELGSRIWFSSGRVQTEAFSDPNIFGSRLIYAGLGAMSGEVFYRADHKSGLFFKSVVGTGVIGRGHLNDEDSLVFSVYSNTLSTQKDGTLSYINTDVGWSFLSERGSKFGAFVGYSYYNNQLKAFGCDQVAGDPICDPRFGPVSPNFVIISEEATWHSIRLGLSGQFALTDRLMLSGEVAYLSVHNLKNLDLHVARAVTFPTGANPRNGVQLEAVLTYNVWDNWSIGVGGRYWAFFAPNMLFSTVTPFGEPAGPDGHTPYYTQRWGGFLQASYKFGDVTSRHDAPAHGQGYYKALPPPIVAVSWTGFYIGAHLAGATGFRQWSPDPFPAVVVAGPFGTFVNVPGFGHSYPVDGTAGGGQIGFNYQIGASVVGVELDADWADLNGGNTCFSSRSGYDCKTRVRSFGTLTGRVGYAWLRSLLYLKGGLAWMNERHTLNADTFFNREFFGVVGGVSNISDTKAGLAIGAGIEHAFGPNWSAKVEYNYLSFATHTVVFEGVVVPGLGVTPQLDLKQDLHVAKVGLNYRFGG